MGSCQVQWAQPCNWAACSQIRPMTLNSFPLHTPCGRSFPAPAAGDANYRASCLPAAASGAARQFLCHRPGPHPLRRVGGHGGGGSRVNGTSSGGSAPGRAAGQLVTRGPGPPRGGPVPRTGFTVGRMRECAEELASGHVRRTDCPRPRFSRQLSCLFSLPSAPFCSPSSMVQTRAPDVRPWTSHRAPQDRLPLNRRDGGSAAWVRGQGEGRSWGAQLLGREDTPSPLVPNTEVLLAR